MYVCTLSQLEVLQRRFLSIFHVKNLLYREWLALVAVEDLLHILDYLGNAHCFPALRALGFLLE